MPFPHFPHRSSNFNFNYETKPTETILINFINCIYYAYSPKSFFSNALLTLN